MDNKCSYKVNVPKQLAAQFTALIVFQIGPQGTQMRHIFYSFPAPVTPVMIIQQSLNV